MTPLIVWTLGGFLPLCASIALVVVYWKRWSDIQDDPHVPIGEPVRIPAQGNLRREITRIIGNVLFVAAGLWSISIRLWGVGWLFDDGGYFTLVLLLAGQWLIGSNSITDWIDNLRLSRAVMKWDQEYVPVEKKQADDLAECLRLLREQHRGVPHG